MNLNERMPHFVVNSRQKAILDGMSTSWQTESQISQATGASRDEIDTLRYSGVILQKYERDSDPHLSWRLRDSARIDVKLSTTTATRSHFA